MPPLPNLKIKDKVETKTKSEEKKNELPPLPNLKRDNTSNSNKGSINNSDEGDNLKDNLKSKKNNTFKMDTSFLKND